MQNSEKLLSVKALIVPWKAIPSLAEQGSLIKSFLAVIISGVTFATIQLLNAHLRGWTISWLMIRFWYASGVILCIVGWVVLSFVSYFIALLLLHSVETPVDITPFLRVSGYAIFPFAFWSLQWVGWLISFYGLYVWVLATRHGFECDYDKAVIISIPTIVIYLFLAMVGPSCLFPPMRIGPYLD